MTALLAAGALAGYALLMATNPVRVCLQDGLRAVRRYPRFWAILGLFGFGYALFQLALRTYFYLALPAGEGPGFQWFRAAYRPGLEWWYGTAESVWAVPPGTKRELAKSALLPALDSLGGLFNSVVSTFPISALAALLFLINWSGYATTLRKAFTKRFGATGWLFHLLLLASAVVAVVKPGLYVLPRYIDAEIWYLWSPVVAWFAFVFEYFFGVGMQVYLLLLAYCWLRGLSFQHRQLFALAIRRFSFVVRWAVVVLLLSTVLIDLPLILKNFALFSKWFEADAAVIDQRNAIARAVLNVIFIACAAVQITLVFHNESLRRSFRDHWRFVSTHTGAFVWFIVLASVHFFLLHLLNALSAAALGEGTAPWIAWTLLFPWVAGFVTAWLLAAWVSLLRRTASGKLGDREWVRF